MSKSVHLFVGGPWDGRRISVDASADCLRAPAPEVAGFVTNKESAPRATAETEYRRAKLYAPGREWTVFAASSIAEGDLIERLIAGYDVRHQEDSAVDVLRDLLQQIEGCDGTAQIDISKAELLVCPRDR